jgi:hypothetical protein
MNNYSGPFGGRRRVWCHKQIYCPSLVARKIEEGEGEGEEGRLFETKGVCRVHTEVDILIPIVLMGRWPSFGLHLSRRHW